MGEDFECLGVVLTALFPASRALFPHSGDGGNPCAHLSPTPTSSCGASSIPV